MMLPYESIGGMMGSLGGKGRTTVSLGGAVDELGRG